ncbi:hypothetical protein Tco_1265338 [Tanacetum coccineum]
MSTSSSSLNRRNHRVNNQLCTCKLPVRVLTTWTLDNPSRRFLVCSNRNILNGSSLVAAAAFILDPFFLAFGSVISSALGSQVPSFCLQ